MKYQCKFFTLLLAGVLASCVTPERRAEPTAPATPNSGTSGSANLSRSSATASAPTGSASAPATGGGFMGDVMAGFNQALATRKVPWAYWDERPGYPDTTRHWCLMDPKTGTKFANAVKGTVGKYRDGTYGVNETSTTFWACQRLEDTRKLTVVGYFAAQKAVDRVGLRKILPQYDDDQPLEKQFPRVAITVLESPPNWAQVTALPRGYALGCWRVAATVWDSPTKSRKVPPFQFCLPQDGSDEMAFGASATWPTRAEKDIPHLTGVKRTDGPRPPSTIMPLDQETDARAAAHGGRLWQSSVNSRLYFETPVGNMLGVLRFQMGARDSAESHDMRVWIVEIR